MTQEQSLAAMVRAKHPGAYDDMDDAALEAAVTTKFPGVYDDLVKRKPEPAQRPEQILAASDPNYMGAEADQLGARANDRLPAIAAGAAAMASGPGVVLPAIAAGGAGYLGARVRGDSREDAAGEGAMQGLLQGAAAGAPRMIGALGRRAYQAALKPTQHTLDRMTGGGSDVQKIRQLVDTAADEGINVSRGGFEKAEGVVDSLNEQIAAKIAPSTAQVDRGAVVSRIAPVVSRFRNQVTPLSDLREIGAKGREFVHTNRPQIPVQRAQAMKQGTYKALKGKFGEEKSAAVEAQKALARGLKEEVATAVPEVGPLNARESAVLHLRTALEGAMRRTGNRDVVGLTDVVAAGTNPKMLAATFSQRAPVMGALGLAGMKTGKAVDPNALRALLPLLFGGGE